ncbi:MAG: flippase-like domain-containing protein [Rhodospirillaceae bacterium]|nr:flippase-like domain-containing protein [Rhodospirillaceae bacterium]
MRILRWICLLLGVGLLGIIVANTNIEEAAHLVVRMEWGIALVLLIYFATFLGDTASWHITLRSVPLDGGWFYRLWLIRMIGEAFNNTLPAGGVGGEPIKAVLLKQHFDVAYDDGAASLFLAKTVNMISLTGFLAIGFILMQSAHGVPAYFPLVAGIGLGVLCMAILAFFLIQRFGASSSVASWLTRWSRGRRLAAAIEHITGVERKFEVFYARSPGRFAAALVVAFSVWVVSIAEVYVALWFLGHPVSWAEAWIIEAGTQLVRTGTFFIPASLGTLDGALLLLCSAFTGSPTAGVAVVLARRSRDILWISLGFGLSLVLGRDNRSRAP